MWYISCPELTGMEVVNTGFEVIEFKKFRFSTGIFCAQEGLRGSKHDGEKTYHFA